MNRKYIIRKLRSLSNLDKIKPRHRRRKEFYDGYVRAAFVRCWEIFDYPCGQRLKQILEMRYRGYKPPNWATEIIIDRYRQLPSEQ